MEANKLLTDPGTDIFRHLAALTDCPRALAKEAVYRLIYGRRHSTAGNYIPPQLWDVIEQLLPKTSVTSSTKEGASTLMRVAMRELAAARADATQKLQEAGHKVCLVGHDYLVVDVPDSWAQGKFGVFDREDAHHKALHQSPVVTKNSLEVAQTFAAAGGGLVVTYQVGNLVGLWGSKHKGNQTHTLALDNTAT
jgi:hypothetical protein